MEPQGFLGYSSADPSAFTNTSPQSTNQLSGFLGFVGEKGAIERMDTSRIDGDIFYNPQSDEEWDEYIAQRVAEGFDVFDAISKLPGAIGAMFGEIKDTFTAAAKEDKLETFAKAVPSGVEGVLRGTTDLGGLLMQIASGTGGMMFNVATGDSEQAYKQLPDFIKDASRQWFKMSRSIQQRRAKQYMGEASFLPDSLINNSLAEGLSIFLDASVPLSLGTSAIAKGGAKALAKGSVKPVSKNLAKFVVNTGKGADAIFSASTAIPRFTGATAAKAVDATGQVIDKARDAAVGAFPKRQSGKRFIEPPQMFTPTLDWLRRNTNNIGEIGKDAMDLRTAIKEAVATPHPSPVLQRIARDTNVPVGARDIAHVLNSFTSKHPYLSFSARRITDVAEGAAIGGVMGLMTFDEDIAANAMAGGALFGPAGKLAGSLIFSPEYKKSSIDNFLDEHRSKLSDDESATFEKFVEGDREKEKLVAGLSYLIKNGHYRHNEGGIDIRYMKQAEVDTYSKITTDEILPHVRGVHRVTGGRPEIIINVDQANIDTFAHEVGHAFAGMPILNEAFKPQMELLFGRQTVGEVVHKGKTTIEFDYDGTGMFSKDSLDTFYKEYYKSATPELQKVLDKRLDNPARKRRYAVEEITADSMANFFKRFDPMGLVEKKSIGNFFKKAQGSYKKPTFSLNPKSVLGGLVDMMLFRRNSLGLVAAHNAGLAMGMVKKGDPIKGIDSRVDANFIDILQARREVMNAPDVKASDTQGMGFTITDLRKKENADVKKFLEPSLPMKVNSKGESTGVILTKTQLAARNRKANKELQASLSNVVQPNVIPNMKPLGKIDPDNPKSKQWVGDYIGPEQMDAILALPQMVVDQQVRKNLVLFNDLMKNRITNGGSGIIEALYTKAHSKDANSLQTGMRDILPMGFRLDGNGLIKLVGLDVNDVASRIEKYQTAVKGPMKEIWDMWRKEGKAKEVEAKDLFLQDLWTYLSGLSQGIPGERLVGVDKRDALSTFLDFRKKDFQKINPSQFVEIMEESRLINSFFIENLQNITRSPGNQLMTERAYYGSMGNLSPITKDGVQ